MTPTMRNARKRDKAKDGPGPARVVFVVKTAVAIGFLFRYPPRNSTTSKRFYARLIVA